MRIFRKSGRSFILLVAATIVTLGITLASYNYITRQTQAQNWDVLENASATEAKLLRTKLLESTKTLDFVAAAVAREGNYTDAQRFAERIKVVQERTIFEGIDMMLPDNTVLFNSGRKGAAPEGEFQRLLAYGSTMTGRTPGHLNKDRYFVRYITPVVENGETKALLIGSINCGSLQEYFQPDAFNGQVIFCIVDARDGLFLLDNWHRHLGSIYDMVDRAKLSAEDGKKDVHEEIGQMRTGSVSFVSETNGKKTYMYYRPLYFYSWMLLLGVQEDVVFANLLNVKHVLWLSGLFILMFFVWNVLTMRKLNVANEMLSTELEKSKRLEGSLKQALGEAQKANQAKSDFLSRMSHDIRTPINGILGMLEIIHKQRADESRVDDALIKIKTSAKHLLTLINSVLDMGKLVSGNIISRNENFNLHEVFNECRIILESQLQAANVTYSAHTEEVRHYALYGNELYLRQILLNLVSNAIKYNKPNGSVDFTACELKHDAEKVWLKFKIHDTGIGMSEEFIRNGLFHTFEQENPGVRTEFNGTGLGMAIVHKLVEHMGGTIAVQSRQGVGTVFTVCLPFMLAHEAAAGEQDEMQEQNLAGLHLLVAEDNALNMEIVEFLLQDAGATYDCAYDGREAVELFAGHEAGTYDAVLLDIMMPEMNGLEAARKLRALPRKDAARIPIIAMTANAFEEDKAKTKEAGMNEHLVKPLDKKLMVQVIRKCIESSRQ